MRRVPWSICSFHRKWISKEAVGLIQRAIQQVQSRTVKSGKKRGEGIEMKKRKKRKGDIVHRLPNSIFTTESQKLKEVVHLVCKESWKVQLMFAVETNEEQNEKRERDRSEERGKSNRYKRREMEGSR